MNPVEDGTCILIELLQSSWRTNPYQTRHDQRQIFGTCRTYASLDRFHCAYTQPVPDVLGQCCSKPGEFRISSRARCRPKRFPQAEVSL